MTNKKELKELADWMEPYALGNGHEKLIKIARSLRWMQASVCDQGIPGCYVKNCTADHK